MCSNFWPVKNTKYKASILKTIPIKRELQKHITMLSSLFTAPKPTPDSDSLFKPRELPEKIINVYEHKSRKKEAKKGEVVIEEVSGKRIVKGGKKRVREEAKRKEKEAKGSDDSESGSESVSESSGSDPSPAITTPTTPTTATTPAPSNSNSNSNSKTAQDNLTIFVGNLPVSATRKTLQSLFSSFGGIISTRLRSTPTETSKVQLPPHLMANIVGENRSENIVKKVSANLAAKNNATSTSKTSTSTSSKQTTPQIGYVVFKDVASVSNAVTKMNNHEIEPGRRLRVDFVSKPESSDAPSDHLLSVFCGNLPYLTTEDALRSHFETITGANSVTNVRIVRDKETHKCKGIGYVAFQERSMVSTALRVGGTTFMKKEIRVDVCGKLTKGKRGEGGGKKRKRNGGEEAAGGEAAAATGGESDNGEKIGAFRRVISNSNSNSNSKSRNNNFKGNGKGKDKGKDKDKDKDKKRGAKAVVRGPSQSKGPATSKRKATEKKVVDRVKKLEKRVKKGMGKQKNS